MFDSEMIGYSVMKEGRLSCLEQYLCVKVGFEHFRFITNKTRMTTFIKTKFKISDDQMNIDKYRLAANITEYHIIPK